MLYLSVIQLPAHDPHISVASHVDHDKIDDQVRNIKFNLCWIHLPVIMYKIINLIVFIRNTATCTWSSNRSLRDVSKVTCTWSSVYVINPEKVWTNNATNYVVDYAKGEKLNCAVHWKDVSKVSCLYLFDMLTIVFFLHLVVYMVFFVGIYSASS